MELKYDDIYMIKERVWFGTSSPGRGIHCGGTFELEIINKNMPMDSIVYHNKYVKYAKIPFSILSTEAREFIKDGIIALIEWNEERTVCTYTYMSKQDVTSEILQNDYYIGVDGKIKIKI